MGTSHVGLAEPKSDLVGGCSVGSLGKKATGFKEKRKKMTKIIMTRGLCLLHASILVDYVGPPSVEICRITANFP